MNKDEIILTEKRRKIREALKTEFRKKVDDPFKFNKGFGAFYDPAIERFMAMRATTVEYFRPTFKTSSIAILAYILPVALMSYIFIQHKRKQRALLGSGQVSYKDRLYKLSTM